MEGKCVELGFFRGEVTRAKDLSWSGFIVFTSVPSARWENVPGLSTELRELAAEFGKENGKGWRFELVHEPDGETRVTPVYENDLYSQWLQNVVNSEQ